MADKERLSVGGGRMWWRDGDRIYSVEICYVFLYLITAPSVMVTVNRVIELQVIVQQLWKSILTEFTMSGVRAGCRRRTGCAVAVLIARTACPGASELGDDASVQFVPVPVRSRQAGRSASLVLSSAENRFGRVLCSPRTSEVSASRTAKVFDVLTTRMVAEIPLLVISKVYVLMVRKVPVVSEVRRLEMTEAHATVFVVASHSQHAAKVAVHRFDRVAALVITDRVFNAFAAGLLTVPHVLTRSVVDGGVPVVVLVSSAFDASTVCT